MKLANDANGTAHIINEQAAPQAALGVKLATSKCGKTFAAAQVRAASGAARATCGACNR